MLTAYSLQQLERPINERTQRCKLSAKRLTLRPLWRLAGLLETKLFTFDNAWISLEVDRKSVV